MSRVGKCMLMLVGLALMSVPSMAGRDPGSGCVAISADPSGSYTMPGYSIAVGGSISNCGSARGRYTLTSTTTTSCGVTICKASKRITLNAGENTLYNISCTPPAGSCTGPATTTNVVTGNGTASASASWEIR